MKEAYSKLRYLTTFIDIICAIIATHAFKLFVDNFQILKFSCSINEVSKIILFTSACIVLVYDWVIYHWLIEKLPYRKKYFPRFFLDLIIFFLMYLLFAVVLKDFFLYFVLIIIWFVIVGVWHTIAWFQFKNDFNLKEIPKKGMISNYKRGIFCLSLYFIFQCILRKSISDDLIGIIIGSVIILLCFERFYTVLKTA